MKGEYYGRAPGAAQGERVLLWAEVVKTGDLSNHLVHCAGEIFTPSAQGLNEAEPTAADLKMALRRMEEWERATAATQAATERAEVRHAQKATPQAP